MKQFFFLSMMLLLISASAQSEGGYFTGGVSMSKYSGSGVDSKSRIGYTVGFEVDETFATKWIWIVGAKYSQIGDKDVRVNAVSFPFMIGRKLGDNFHLGLGSRLNIFTEVRDQDKKRIESGVDLLNEPGLDLGARLAWISGDKSFVYLEYYRSLTSAFSENNDVSFTSFNVGYAWRFIE